MRPSGTAPHWPGRIALGWLAATAGLLNGAAYGADWSLMAREGGCHPISSLRRKIADLPELRDPDGFEAFVKSRGWAYERKPHPATPGKAVEFVVESQGLALVFVTAELCTPPPRR